MDVLESQPETTISELGNLKMIAKNKENELFFEREKTKKAIEEVSVLKGTVESLSSWMAEMEKRIEVAEELTKLTQARMGIEFGNRGEGQGVPKFFLPAFCLKW